MSLTRVAGFTLAALALAGCQPARAPSQAFAALAAPSPRERTSAARDVGHHARAHHVAPEAVPRLLWSLAYEPDPRTRILLVEALGDLGGPEVVAGLVGHLAHEPHDDVRLAIHEVLAESGDLRVEPFLRAYLQTNDYEQQRERRRIYRRLIVASGGFVPATEQAGDWPYGAPGFPDPVYGGTVWIDGAPAPPKLTVKAEAGVTARVLFDAPIVAFELDTVLAARTRSGIWGARFGTYQGALTSGLGAGFFHVGPTWEAPTPIVRPSLQLRVGWMHVNRYTDHGDAMAEFTIGLRLAVTFDLWRHRYDHALYLSLAGNLDGVPDGPTIPGGSLALGARF
jgi:hypothetical protein